MSERSALPEQFNFAAHLLAGNAGRGAKTAYVDDHGTLSYRELADRVRRAAAGLRALGVRREERVLLLMHDGNDWPVSFLGALHAGVVPVAVNTLLTAGDCAFMLEHSRAQAAFVSGPLLPVLRSAMAQSQHELRAVVVSRPEQALADGEFEFERFLQEATPSEDVASTRPDDVAFWLCSSGSTGRPKAVVHTHANPYWAAQLYGKAVLALTERDICFSAAKLFFAYGLGNALTFPLSVGATTVLMAQRATPEATFRRWIERQPTVFFGAPTGYAGLLASPNLPPASAVALRLASSAGEALPPAVGQRFRAHFGIDIIDGLGSTEMLHVFLSNRPGEVRYGTSGRPVDGYRVELRDSDGWPVGCGEPGDLYVQGPSSALMYWRDRANSREAFQGTWTRSGDKYVANADGTYTYAGRIDDMLKVSGIYVSPFEVEATLMEHPAVLEAAVVGTPDREGLTKSKAFVVLRPGAAATEPGLKPFVKDRLAPYKYPRSIEFVAELPKTTTGKIQRFRLRET